MIAILIVIAAVVGLPHAAMPKASVDAMSFPILRVWVLVIRCKGARLELRLVSEIDKAGRVVRPARCETDQIRYGNPRKRSGVSGISYRYRQT